MLSKNEALVMLNEKLGDSEKYHHSLRVGNIMVAFAVNLDEDQELFYIVGICHDLDYENTKDDLSKHGIQTSEYLHDRLPEKALDAIASHDYRTGVKSNNLLSVGLRAADSLDAISGIIPFDKLQKLISQPDLFHLLKKELRDRSYLLDNIQELTNSTDTDIKDVIGILTSQDNFFNYDRAIKRGPVC